MLQEGVYTVSLSLAKFDLGSDVFQTVVIYADSKVASVEGRLEFADSEEDRV